MTNGERFRFEHVFRAELDDINERRRHNSLHPLAANAGSAGPTAALGLSALSLSGGGVRAASFSLGVLQALDAKGVLKCIDYLSTVSGGGYIGTSLTVALSKNRGAFPFTRSHEGIETPELRHVRDNSRYLVQNGFPSILSAFAVYMRGIVMNLLVLVPLLLMASATLIFLGRRRPAMIQWLEATPILRSAADVALPFSVIAGAILLLLWALYAIVVSVHCIAGLSIRQRLAWTAAIFLGTGASIFLLELHVVLLLRILDPGFFESFGRIVSVTAGLWPLLLAVLPFVRTLGGIAARGSDSNWSDLAKRVLSKATLLVAATVFPFFVWLAGMELARRGFATPELFNEYDAAEIFAGAALILFGSWPFLNVNANSLHQLYRDRLSKAFIFQRRDACPDGILESADDFCLSGNNPQYAPYHLINSALNIPGSKFANLRGRNAGFFIFSPRFIGGELTGYVATKDAERVVDRLNIGTAMAISGAAVAPNMGVASIKALSPTIAFLNLRLGRWVQHPAWIAHRAAKLSARGGSARELWFRRIPGPRYLLREAFSKAGIKLWRQKSELTDPKFKKQFVLLSDGGHIENLGVYELLRRRCSLIIAVDAEADFGMHFHSLTQLARLARIDFDTGIFIDWAPISARTRAVTEEVIKRAVNICNGPHIAIGRIDYPPVKGGEGIREQGILVYIKASLSGDENDYILGYKAKRMNFPHESTADQIFSEEQLEVYRALGEHIVSRFFEGLDEVAAQPNQLGCLLTQIRATLPALSPSFQLKGSADDGIATP